ncbi:hypothetical protein L3V86_09470, partial [Thiotrichales bacterium 19S11-10]|nr:hypothetical protein [Thiotrichales bacterium 19S11-10]
MKYSWGLNTFKVIILIFFTMSMLGCNEEISTSADTNPASGSYTLKETPPDEKIAVIAATYKINVSLEADTEVDFEVGLESSSSSQVEATDIQLSFLNPVNNSVSRFIVEYSNTPCNATLTTSCIITVIPADNAYQVEGKSVGYFIEGKINGEVVRLGVDSFVVQTLTAEKRIFAGVGTKTLITFTNETGVPVNIKNYHISSTDNEIRFKPSKLSKRQNLSESLPYCDNLDESILQNHSACIVSAYIKPQEKTSRSSYQVTNTIDHQTIRVIDGVINIIRPIVTLSTEDGGGLKIRPRKVKYVTLENNSPVIAEIKDIYLDGVFEGVTLDKSDCPKNKKGYSILKAFDSCDIELQTKDNAAGTGNLVVEGINFTGPILPVTIRDFDPPIGFGIKLHPNPLILSTYQTRTITIENVSPINVHISDIDLRNLHQVSLVDKENCLGELKRFATCDLTLQSSEIPANEKGHLWVVGKGFTPARATVLNNMSDLPSVLHVRLDPKDLTLWPEQRKYISVENNSPKSVQISNAYLSSNLKSHVSIVNKLSQLDKDGSSLCDLNGGYLYPNNHCLIELKANKDLGDNIEGNLFVASRDFGVRAAKISTKAIPISIIPAEIKLNPNQVTFKSKGTEEITVMNLSPTMAVGMNVSLEGSKLFGVVMDETTCLGRLASLNSCVVVLRSKKESIGKGRLVVSGDNFVTRRADIKAKNINSPIAPTEIAIDPKILYLTSTDKYNLKQSILIKNLSRFEGHISAIDLNDIENVTLSGVDDCLNKPLVKESPCKITFIKDKEHPPAGVGKLIVKGKNFIHKTALLVTNDTMIELKPSVLTLEPGDIDKSILIENLSKISAKNLNIILPNLRDINITNNCGNSLGGNDSCNIKFTPLSGITSFNKAKLIVGDASSNFKPTEAKILVYSSLVEVYPKKLSLIADTGIHCEKLQHVNCITVTNTSPVKAKITDITLPDLGNFVDINNNCIIGKGLDDNGNLQPAHTCTITFNVKRNLLNQSDNLVVSGKNFKQKQSEISVSRYSPPIKPTIIRIKDTPIIITPGDDDSTKVTIQNLSKVPAKNLEANLYGELKDITLLSNQPCSYTDRGNNEQQGIAGKSECTFYFDVEGAPFGAGTLKISGDNFLPVNAKVAVASTSIRLSPSSVNLDPKGDLTTLTVKNLSPSPANISSVSLVDFRGVLRGVVIQNDNCTGQELKGLGKPNSSCTFDLKARQSIASGSGIVLVSGDNFRSKQSAITVSSTNIQIDPSPIILSSNGSKNITIKNMGSTNNAENIRINLLHQRSISKDHTKLQGVRIDQENTTCTAGITLTANGTSGDSCTIAFVTTDALGIGSLVVLGNNFMPAVASVEVNSTAIELRPDNIILAPSSDPVGITIQNLTPATAKISNIY